MASNRTSFRFDDDLLERIDRKLEEDPRFSTRSHLARYAIDLYLEHGEPYVPTGIVGEAIQRMVTAGYFDDPKKAIDWWLTEAIVGKSRLDKVVDEVVSERTEVAKRVTR